MSVLATDNFNRANNASLGANWTTLSGAQAPEIVSNQATNSGTSIGGARYSATAAPNDQYAKCTIAALPSTSDEGPGPGVRWAAAALTGYFAQCNTVEIKLYKVVAGSFTQLGSDAGPATVGDVIEIRAQGTAITVLKNGSAIIGPITDGDIASGAAGMWNTSATFRSCTIDDFEMGDFGGGGGSPMPKRLLTLGVGEAALAVCWPAIWRWRRMRRRVA